MRRDVKWKKAYAASRCAHAFRRFCSWCLESTSSEKSIRSLLAGWRVQASQLGRISSRSGLPLRSSVRFSHLGIYVQRHLWSSRTWRWVKINFSSCEATLDLDRWFGASKVQTLRIEWCSIHSDSDFSALSADIMSLGSPYVFTSFGKNALLFSSQSEHRDRWLSLVEQYCTCCTEFYEIFLLVSTLFQNLPLWSEENLKVEHFLSLCTFSPISD